MEVGKSVRECGVSVYVYECECAWVCEMEYVHEGRRYEYVIMGVHLRVLSDSERICMSISCECLKVCWICVCECGVVHVCGCVCIYRSLYTRASVGKCVCENMCIYIYIYMNVGI